jgi:hypothetical protein
LARAGFSKPSAAISLRPVPLILDAILRATLEFSGGEGKMRDDLTLVVARDRG